jgi:hypothetical protein
MITEACFALTYHGEFDHVSALLVRVKGMDSFDWIHLQLVRSRRCVQQANMLVLTRLPSLWDGMQNRLDATTSRCFQYASFRDMRKQLI